MRTAKRTERLKSVMLSTTSLFAARDYANVWQKEVDDALAELL